MTSTTPPTSSTDTPASLLPAGVRSFSTVAEYRTAWHTVPAGRYLLLHVSGCDRIAQQERFFGDNPIYEFTGFVTEHTSNLAIYAEHYHESLPCTCLPNPDYFAPLPDGTHWHLPRAFDTARHAVILEIDGQWKPVAWCQRRDQAEELARHQPGTRVVPVRREFPHPPCCR